MEKENLVRNDGMMMKLPIGFRFHPTDEELVVHYLNRKIHSFPLPASVIPDLDGSGDSKEKRYFFCKRSKKNVNKCKGITGSGYWKAMGKEKYIISPGSNQVVRVKIFLS
ncbi:NAC domain-containing protein 83-like [Camellia sinensis]|uniref:NAC domain-containing protein 83-like n=1 Tax=Camellia sinensis TaxID=4442 RepID=UPI001036046D|nr:NAC domain-containing protein 83-like [Camellia sinensis]